MANRVSGWVWHHSPEKGSARLVLLALSDCAHPDGDGAYPSVALLRDMTRLSERAVQYVLRGLERHRSIVRTGSHPTTGCNIWRVVIPADADRFGRRGANFAPRGGAKVTPMGASRRKTRVQALAPEPGTEPSLEPPEQSRLVRRSGLRHISDALAAAAR